eukprot:m.68844 g.68844  ORF g.68844 m.68844 type:complete len:959 (+) comp9941_c0_seq2:224-3100(+)
MHPPNPPRYQRRRCWSSLALLFLVQILRCQGQLATRLRIGWLGSEDTPIGLEATAAFLTAIKAVNGDPFKYLGNSTLSVEPYVFTSATTLDPYQLQAQRDMAFMTAKPACYGNAANTTLLSAANRGGLDAHAVIVDGPKFGLPYFVSSPKTNGKPVVGTHASQTDFSNKDKWPTFSRVYSPEKYEAMAFARLVNDMGWHRVGLVVSDTHLGMAHEFKAACRILGVSVVTTVSFHAQTHTPNISAADVVTATTTGQRMRQAFLEANVKVYLCIAHYYHAGVLVSILRTSGQFGPGYTMLTASTLTPPTTFETMVDDEWAEFLREACPIKVGSLGLQPFYDPQSEGGVALLRNWPKNNSDWAHLRDQSPQGQNYNDTTIPTRTPSVWSHYVWDATVLTSRVAADALTNCTFGDTMDTDCFVNLLRTKTIEGATGRVQLDNNGDRLGSFYITNAGISGSKAVGQLHFGGPNVLQSRASIVFRDIEWSDNSTNQSIALMWGQSTAAPTQASTIQAPAQHSSSGDGQDVDRQISIGVVIGSLFLMTCLYALWCRHVIKKKENARADFNEIIERLLKHGLLGGETQLSGGGIPANAEVDIKIPRELERSSVLLTATIGQGQFGNVNSGFWRTTSGRSRLNVAIAIKTLQSSFNQSRESQLAFLEEAAVTWQFDHPNVVKMYGVVSCGYPYLIVLELCEPGSLLHNVKAREYSTLQLLGFLHGVATGMAYLASKHFVHRDLAARNILLDSQHTPKISDFGLGRCVEGDDYYRMSSEALLPLRWTDPGAVITLKFTEATDVWAFGITAIEVFSRGDRPYGDWSNGHVLEQVQKGHRLERPRAMPHDVYERSVLPCWMSTNSSTSHRDTDQLQRPSFVVLTSILADLRGVETQSGPRALSSTSSDNVDLSTGSNKAAMHSVFRDDISTVTNLQNYEWDSLENGFELYQVTDVSTRHVPPNGPSETGG